MKQEQTKLRYKTDVVGSMFPQLIYYVFGEHQIHQISLDALEETRKAQQLETIEHALAFEFNVNVEQLSLIK
jgi:hypothetical protein